MQHYFNVEIAKRYGMHCAVILNNIQFWIEKNKANDKHFYDGHYWTYNSKQALLNMMPYMTSRQIDYALDKLVKDGLLIKGNYNKSTYDRTLWYAITDLGYKILENREVEEEEQEDESQSSEDCEMHITNLQNPSDNIVESKEQNCEIETTNLSNPSHKIGNSILQNCEMESTKLSNPFHTIVQPIPDNNKDNIKDNNTDNDIYCRADASESSVGKANVPPLSCDVHFEENNQSDTDNQNSSTTRKSRKRNAKSSVSDEMVAEIIDYLNSKTGAKFQANCKETKRHINARVQEGATLEDFKTVIDKKVAQWGCDERMVAYLRPITLFGTKFRTYLAEQSVAGKSSNKFHNFEQRDTDYNALVSEYNFQDNFGGGYG